MKYSNSFFGVAEGAPFNLPAAIEAYEWVMANPDTYEVVISKALLDYVPDDIARNRAKVDAAVDRWIQGRIEKAQRGLLRTVSKGMSETQEQIVLAVDEIAKAYGSSEYTPWERRANAMKQTRNEKGWFTEMGAKEQEEVATRIVENRIGVKRDTLKPKQRQKFDRETKTVLDALRAELGASAASGKPDVDTLALFTQPDFASSVNKPLKRATGGWNALGADDYRTDDQFWRRMQAAAGLSSAVAAGTGNQQAAAALAAGAWAGSMAPEAEKVMGPTARRAAYRYRGTEKKPNPAYQRYIDQARRHYPNTDKAHEAVLRGSFDLYPIRPGNPTAGTKEVWTPSPLIEALQKTLPDPQRYHLNRKSGTIPPSQGIIIDNTGKVTTEAVGYGEDWYVPFNLSNMKSLRGGEYIRTRAFGGPTTEDITVGLMSGARAVTVVSHSGVFTIEFDEKFKGSRRYNDKAGRMSKRYGQLLDAVKSREVSLGSIPPERLEELKEQAARRYSPDLDTKAYKDYLNKLKEKESEDPRLADATKKEILTQLLNERIQDDGLGADFQSYQMQMEERARKLGDTNALERISTPEKAVAALGLEFEAKKALDDAQATYEQEMNPLDLNGRGYYQALKSLQDQFPYYIKDVWHTDFHSGGKDFGYVKPKFIRPEGALAGYYDPSITGKGKVSADKTNYQNYPVMQQKEFAPGGRYASEGPEGTLPKALRDRLAEKDKESAKTTTSSPPTLTGPLQGAQVGAKEDKEGGPKASSNADRTEATLEMVSALRNSRKFAPGAGAGFAGQAPTPADIQSMQSQFPELFGKDEDDIRLALYRNGPESEYYAKLRDEIDRLLVMDYFVVDDSVKRAYQQGRTTTLKEAPQSAMEYVSSYKMIDKGKIFDFPEVPKDRSRQFYNSIMEDYLKGSEGLRDAGITTASDRAEIVDAATKRGMFLADQWRIWSRRDAGLNVPVPPVISTDDIERESRYMAYVVQAAVLRDDTPEPPIEETQGTEVIPTGKDEVIVSDQEKERIKSAVAAQGVTKRKEKVKQLQAKINSMIGMDQVSKEIDSLINEAEVNEYLKAHDMPVTPPIRHMIFAGAPGTGKTTVAGILAPIYNEMGLIPSDKVVIKSRDDLVQANQGNTEAAVKAAFEEAKGGVLFIDEAYSLKVDDMDTLGQIALNSINQKASENQDDTVVILAGYEDDMKRLLKNNEGLRSRFPTTIHFRNYNSKEMKEIAEKMMKDDGYRMLPGSRASAIMGQATNKIATDPNSANGRDVFNLYQKIVRAHKNRLAGTVPTKSELEVITADDVIEGISLYDENFLNRRNSAVA